MTGVEPQREVIASGRQPMPGYRHLLPIAKFLIEERGHMAIENPENYGFTLGQCDLTRSITAEDWAAINERFELPETIGFRPGIIRDNLNRVDILGHDELIGENGPEPIEVWEAHLRAQARE